MKKNTRKEAKKVGDLAANIRGLPNNKWGGHRNTSLSAKGTFGPASEGRVLQPNEWAVDEKRYLEKMRELDEKAGRRGVVYLPVSKKRNRN